MKFFGKMIIYFYFVLKWKKWEFQHQNRVRCPVVYLSVTRRLQGVLSAGVLFNLHTEVHSLVARKHLKVFENAEVMIYAVRSPFSTSRKFPFRGWSWRCRGHCHSFLFSNFSSINFKRSSTLLRLTYPTGNLLTLPKVNSIFQSLLCFILQMQ